MTELKVMNPDTLKTGVCKRKEVRRFMCISRTI